MRAPGEIALVTLSAATTVAALGYVVWRRYRRPKDPERRRRALIEAHGRIVEGMVTDYQEGIVVYRWSWRGVEYEASQDIRSLLHLLPDGSRNVLVGQASVKFLPRDPANSIIMSERWNGIQTSPTRAS